MGDAAVHYVTQLFQNHFGCRLKQFSVKSPNKNQFNSISRINYHSNTGIYQNAIFIFVIHSKIENRNS